MRSIKYAKTKKLDLNVASCSVRTMFYKANSSRSSERCSALIAGEVSRVNIDIAGQSEVRLGDEGSCQEVDAGFSLF